MSEEDEARDALLVDLTKAVKQLIDQHYVVCGLVSALIVERAEDDPGATQRLAVIVERAFELNDAQRLFLAQMTSIAPGVAEDSPSLMAH